MNSGLNVSKFIQSGNSDGSTFARALSRSNVARTEDSQAERSSAVIGVERVKNEGNREFSPSSSSSSSSPSSSTESKGTKLFSFSMDSESSAAIKSSSL